MPFGKHTRSLAILLLAGAAAAAQAPKPAPPSVCAIDCELKRTKDRPLAALAVTYQFRTSLPRSQVLLGGQHAFAVKAALDDGGPPALESTADGLIAVIEEPGEHKLTVSYEAAIGPRGTRGDVGFEIGLPRAAITTLTLTAPEPELKAVTLGTRWVDAANKPGELKTASLDPAKLAKSYPLGPTDTLELSWESVKVQPPATEPTLETEVSVRVDETRIETVAQLKLRGPMKEWTLVLPPGAELTAAAGSPAITPPDEAKKREWKVSLGMAAEAQVTATLRQVRDNKAVSVGPFYALGAVRQTGTVKLYAPATLRLVARPAVDVRRQDAGIEEDAPVALYRYHFQPNLERKPTALLDFDVRTAAGFVVVKPHYKLTLTSGGWKLRSEFRIAPVRMALEQVIVELPAGWPAPTFSPLDLVDDVTGAGDGSVSRAVTVRFSEPQREPFELVLESRWPLGSESREANLPLPRLTGVREREAQLSVTVPETLDLSGTAFESDGNKPSASGVELKSPKLHSLEATFDGGVARVDLTWQPYRAKLTVDNRVEVTLSDRQVQVAQTLKMQFPGGAGKPVRLSGPSSLVGFRAVPPVEVVGPGEWLFTPIAGMKETTLTLQYAVPLKVQNGPVKQGVPLVWPEATAAQTVVRVWNVAAARRTAGFDGPWREQPPEPAAERDSLPSLTLAGQGVNLPLCLELADGREAGSVVVDRAAFQWWIAETGGVQGRARFVLRRWPANLDLELSGAENLAVLADRLRVEPALVRDDTVRIALPESRPGRTTLLLEVRFSGATSGLWRETVLNPPRPRGAVYRQPVWWQIAPPVNNLAFCFSGGLDPEFDWQWSPGFAPAAGASNMDLDRWLADGNESLNRPLAGDIALAARQDRPAAVTIVRIPKLEGLLAGAGIVFGLGLLIVRLTSKWRTMTLGLLAVLVAIAVVLAPQPAAQCALAVQGGLLLLVLWFGSQALLRHWLAVRAARTATFSRLPPNSVVMPALEASASRPRPSAVGTPQSAP